MWIFLHLSPNIDHTQIQVNRWEAHLERSSLILYWTLSFLPQDWHRCRLWDTKDFFSRYSSAETWVYRFQEDGWISKLGLTLLFLGWSERMMPRPLTLITALRCSDPELFKSTSWTSSGGMMIIKSLWLLWKSGPLMLQSLCASSAAVSAAVGPSGGFLMQTVVNSTTCCQRVSAETRH